MPSGSDVLDRYASALDSQATPGGRSGGAALPREALSVLASELDRLRRLVLYHLENGPHLACDTLTRDVCSVEGPLSSTIRAAGRTVCQVLAVEADGTARAAGTGVYVIEPNLVLTAGHVVPSEPGACQRFFLRFRFESDCAGGFQTPVDFAIEECVVAPDREDLAVLVAAPSQGGLVIGDLTAPAPAGSTGALIPQAPLFCVQHPRGLPKQAGLGTFVSMREPYVRYDLPTDDCSSGAPVFDDQGRLIAVHSGPDGDGSCAKAGLGIEAILRILSRLP